MKLKRTLGAFILGTLACAAQSALAQHTAGVTVGHLGYQLIDLTPDDGIAPWIGVTSYATQAYASIYDQDGKQIDATRIEHLGSAGFDNGYASLHADAREDSAAIQLALYSGYGFAAADRAFRFTLAPHTPVMFCVDADMWARAEAPGVSWPTALAELYGSLPGFNDDEQFISTFRLEDGARQGALSVTASSQEEWVTGRLAFTAYAVAESHAAPVPEPGAYGMLLGGLAVLTAIGRPRRG
jgi:hypothetical protein